MPCVQPQNIVLQPSPDKKCYLTPFKFTFIHCNSVGKVLRQSFYIGRKILWPSLWAPMEHPTYDGDGLYYGCLFDLHCEMLLKSNGGGNKTCSKWPQVQSLLGILQTTFNFHAGCFRRPGVYYICRRVLLPAGQWLQQQRTAWQHSTWLGYGLHSHTVNHVVGENAGLFLWAVLLSSVWSGMLLHKILQKMLWL